MASRFDEGVVQTKVAANPEALVKDQQFEFKEFYASRIDDFKDANQDFMNHIIRSNADLKRKLKLQKSIRVNICPDKAVTVYSGSLVEGIPKTCYTINRLMAMVKLWFIENKMVPETNPLADVLGISRKKAGLYYTIYGAGAAFLTSFYPLASFVCELINHKTCQDKEVKKSLWNNLVRQKVGGVGIDIWIGRNVNSIVKAWYEFKDVQYIGGTKLRVQYVLKFADLLHEAVEDQQSSDQAYEKLRAYEREEAKKKDRAYKEDSLVTYGTTNEVYLSPAEALKALESQYPMKHATGRKKHSGHPDLDYAGSKWSSTGAMSQDYRAFVSDVLNSKVVETANKHGVRGGQAYRGVQEQVWSTYQTSLKGIRFDDIDWVNMPHQDEKPQEEESSYKPSTYSELGYFLSNASKSEVFDLMKRDFPAIESRNLPPSLHLTALSQNVPELSEIIVGGKAVPDTDESCESRFGLTFDEIDGPQAFATVEISRIASMYAGTEDILTGLFTFDDVLPEILEYAADEETAILRRKTTSVRTYIALVMMAVVAERAMDMDSMPWYSSLYADAYESGD